MPPDLQVKLLHVLETGRFMRVGSRESLAADVCLIAASNRVPAEAVAAGKLREDLFYRLNVFPIEMPPLRERLEDVPLLAQHFLDAIGRHEQSHKRFSAEALERLKSQRWQGNVRELRNVVQRAYVMAPSDVIDGQWLPDSSQPTAQPAAARPAPRLVGTAAPQRLLSVEGDAITIRPGCSLAEAEKPLVVMTLRHYQHHKERAAAALGISLKTLYNRLKNYAEPAPESERQPTN